MHILYKSCFFSIVLLLFTATVGVGAESVHIVKSGDSLWSIARSNGVTVDYLKKINGLKSDNLQIGQRITINSQNQIVSTPVATPASTGNYTVKAGDSLWAIARHYNMTVAQLMQMNGLSSDKLKIGQILKVGNTTTVNITPSPAVAAVAPSRSGESVAGDRIVEYAGQYLGTRYAYGGQSPSGFDCSGFALYVFKQFGYSLPRTAAEQYGCGIAVDRSSLAVGDLVFFACGGSQIDHVGIYCGNNRFIHSSSPRSGGVIYSSLQEGYYANCYVGARKILR
jgi:cell wall-associated NlpC family hydrolase